MIAAVILAAGSSSRMGRPKQTLRVEGVAMLQVVLDTVRRTKVDLVVVVVGAHESEVRKEVDFRGERVIVNKAYDEGMSASIRVGLSEVPDAEAALIVLGDQPLLAPETIDALIQTYLRFRSPIVVPVHRGRRGNPVLFDRSLFKEVLKVTGDGGAKAVVRAHMDDVLEVPVDDEGVVTDVDVPADYDRLISQK